MRQLLATSMTMGASAPYASGTILFDWDSISRTADLVRGEKCVSMCMRCMAWRQVVEHNICISASSFPVRPSSTPSLQTQPLFAAHSFFFSSSLLSPPSLSSLPHSHTTLSLHSHSPSSLLPPHPSLASLVHHSAPLCTTLHPSFHRPVISHPPTTALSRSFLPLSLPFPSLPYPLSLIHI